MLNEIRPTSPVAAPTTTGPSPKAERAALAAAPVSASLVDALTCTPGLIGCRPPQPLLPLEPAAPDPGRAFSDLAKASRKGTWLSVPMHGMTASLSLRVTQTENGFQIERAFRGCFGGSITTIPIRTADLVSGHLSAEAVSALRALHEALHQPPFPEPPQPAPWDRRIPILPKPDILRMPTLPPHFPLPGGVPGQPVGGRVVVKDVDSRFRDLNAGLQKGRMGSTGCTSMAGALEVTRTADGYKISTASGGFITHRSEVTIDAEDLRNGTLTSEQLAALDNLRRHLAEAEGPALVL